jgi:hypothetical protein
MIVSKLTIGNFSDTKPRPPLGCSCSAVATPAFSPAQLLQIAHPLKLL